MMNDAVVRRCEEEIKRASDRLDKYVERRRSWGKESEYTELDIQYLLGRRDVSKKILEIIKDM